MFLPFTLLFGTLGYLYYKSKNEVTLLDDEIIDLQKKQLEDDELYKEFEDLFI